MHANSLPVVELESEQNNKELFLLSLEPVTDLTLVWPWAWKVWETEGALNTRGGHSCCLFGKLSRIGRKRGWWWTWSYQWSGLTYTIWMESDKLEGSLWSLKTRNRLEVQHSALGPHLLQCIPPSWSANPWTDWLWLFLVKCVGFNLGVIPLPSLWPRRQSPQGMVCLVMPLWEDTPHVVEASKDIWGSWKFEWI